MMKIIHFPRFRCKKTTIIFVARNLQKKIGTNILLYYFFVNYIFQLYKTMAPRKSPKRKSPARKAAKRASPGRRKSPVRKSPAKRKAGGVRRRSALQRAHTAFMAKKLKELKRKSPNAKQTTLMKRASAAWKASSARKSAMGGRKTPVKRKSPGRRKSPKRKSPTRRSGRRTPVQAARKRFMNSKRAALSRQMPRAAAGTIQKRANSAWMHSPERKRLMAKRK